MSWTSRLINLLRQRDLNDDLDAEMASHIDEAVERGLSLEEARKAFGVTLKHREQSRDVKLLPWLDALASDVLFGWRQITKHRVASAAAILSLALSIGAATAAWRLVDALMWRNLPVAHPERLYSLESTYTERNGTTDSFDGYDYQEFLKYKVATADHADLMIVGENGSPREATFESAGGTEQIRRQYLSGNVFTVFALRPALGRLLIPSDDDVPGASPVAVLSYDFWTRRFARDPKVVGKTFRIAAQYPSRADSRLEIVGVAPEGFFGTEPGIVTDVFVPASMNVAALSMPGWNWFQIWVRPRPGFTSQQVLQPMQAALLHHPGVRVHNEHLKIQPASAGVSRLRQEYSRPLIILGILVVLVLLIACANVGNLLTAQSAARVREMALRVSIGAGRWRLIQLVLVESALVALGASALGALFAAWSAPFVVTMLHVPGDPIRMVFNTGWKEFVFGIALALFVTVLFGLAPALRASDVKPMKALRGGEDAHSRRRLMNSLLAAQMAFCVLVQFVAGLFVATFERLAHKPLGFTPEHVLIVYADSETPKPAFAWQEIASHLRKVPGVENAAVAASALLVHDTWTGTVRVPGRAPEARGPWLLSVSPGFFATMRIGLLAGRDVEPNDPPSFAVVNESFARVYFDGRNPVGRMVECRTEEGPYIPIHIVGLVRDAVYSNLRDPIRPTMYRGAGEAGNAALLVRTAGDPLAMASILRREVSNVRPDFKVSSVTSEMTALNWNMVRERLLATLSFFFAMVALVLAAVGLYGVLNYSVTCQRREIGIRMALGARPAHVVRGVTTDLFAMVCLGAVMGLAAGLATGRFIEALLFGVKSTDLSASTLPLLTLLAATVLAAIPPALRAVRTDPARTLRSD